MSLHLVPPAEPHALTVDLDEGDMRHAASVAIERQIYNLFRPGLKNTYQAPPEQAWAFHIQGALGEKAVARYYGLPWPERIGDYHARDVGGLQVRSTSLEDGCLIVHDRDKNDDPFILVTGSGPRFCLRGWLLGYEAKQPFYMRSGVRHGAYFVPIEDLRPMASLEVLYWRTA